MTDWFIVGSAIIGTSIIKGNNALHADVIIMREIANNISLVSNLIGDIEISNSRTADLAIKTQRAGVITIKRTMAGKVYHGG